MFAGTDLYSSAVFSCRRFELAPLDLFSRHREPQTVSGSRGKADCANRIGAAEHAAMKQGKSFSLFHDNDKRRRCQKPVSVAAFRQAPWPVDFLSGL